MIKSEIEENSVVIAFRNTCPLPYIDIKRSSRITFNEKSQNVQPYINTKKQFKNLEEFWIKALCEKD